MTISNGTLALSGTTNLYDTGSWSNSGGTFTANSSTVTFNAGSGSQTLSSSGSGTMTGGNAFYDLTFNNASGGWAINSALAATNLTLTNGAVTQSAAVTVTGIYNQTAGTFTCATPAGNTFSANDFRIPGDTNTLYFNRFGGTGDGGWGQSTGDPYIIYDVYALQAMKEKLAGFYQLGVSTIDASSTANWNGGGATGGFVPVGDGSSGTTYYFTGNFNGENDAINTLTAYSGSYDAGLFGDAQLGSNSISNLNLTVQNITGGSSKHAGGLVGYLTSGTISNCSVNVIANYTVKASSGYVGGFVGTNVGTIEQCLCHHSFIRDS